MTLEDNLEAALRYQIRLLNDVALGANIGAAFASSARSWVEPLGPVISCKRNATEAEALFAVILNRAGFSWDQMAGWYGVTKQSLHRRLNTLGEQMYQFSQEYGFDPLRQDNLTTDIADEQIRSCAEVLASLSRRRGSWATPIMFERLNLRFAAKPADPPLDPPSTT